MSVDSAASVDSYFGCRPKGWPKVARKIAVCLSGGGTRAASFSAGVLHEMAEQVMLQDVVLYCSTSGGSITNAFLGTRLPFATQAIGSYKAAFLADQLSKYN